jgi:GrpB-like predicted nucleotidyltransferase (UPF0157 family)
MTDTPTMRTTNAPHTISATRAHRWDGPQRIASPVDQPTGYAWNNDRPAPRTRSVRASAPDGIGRGRDTEAVSPFLVDYDEDWPADFDVERSQLAAVLAEWLIGGIHHIGSTSVPGMPAKPILDMIAGVEQLADADRAEPALGELGYDRHPHRVDAVLFIKQAGEVDTHHLHLTTPASDLWRERLAFRDALRTRPDLADEYVALKLRLLHQAGGRGYDSADKRDFVRRVLAGCGVELRDGLRDTRGSHG